ncbi:heterokaryon incompatibility protein [Colletotrichum chrysophilum]|uniref:Heterokaryon incompatibility protein n=1 Tax=Colletotrichum chrysophilum TaxID=1836956 RepID=A0AAD9A7K9_9PEZI|nr:heterokaryon incompatibility protein [Colletotrichum chrysophilum]
MDSISQRRRRRYSWLSLLADLSFYTSPCYPHKDGGLPHTGCIRLIRFTNTSDGGFDIRWERFPLASAPSYRALSYTWGQATGRWGGFSLTVPFELYKGQRMPSNLWSVIHRLRRLDLEGDKESGWYWIDYISINQSNIRERGEQVGNMHRIYQQAEGVDIWLGTADEHEASASEVSDVLRYIVQYSDSVHRRKAHQWSDFLPDSDWDILASFFSRRWFHRLWTLQEFALASQVRIMLGDGYIDSDLLWNATVLLYSSGYPLPLPYGHNHSAGYAIVQHSTLRRCVEAPNQLLGLLPTFAAREMQMPDYETVLMWVFWRSAATFATDARDYIYGILGVADTIMDRLAQAMGCDSESRNYSIVSLCAPAYTPIKPDYSLDTARVFQDFIVRLMHSSIGIRAITLMQRGETGELRSDHKLQRHAEPTWLDLEGTLPSWVPNLAHKDMFPLSSGLVPLGILNDTKDHDSPRRHPEHDIFGSASNLSTTQRFNITETHLHLFGRRIGVINGSSGHVPYAFELSPCAEFGVNTLNLLANTIPHNSIADDFDPDASALETLLSTLRLGNLRAATLAKNTSGQSNIRMLDERQMETFYGGCLSMVVCILMLNRDKDGRPLDVQAAVEEWGMSRYAKIPGLSADFLAAQVAKWNSPDMMFRWRDKWACIVHGDVLLTVIEGCSTLVNEFHWARGRAVSSVMLDSQLIRDARGAGHIHSQQGDRINLLSLGPSRPKAGDEVWALQGSEWPFVLRRRHRADDGEPVSGRKFSETKLRWWWPWDGGVSDDPGPAVYELRGDIYVHGLMNGELGAELAQDMEEIIIS